jgi:hypothetical protein
MNNASLTKIIRQNVSTTTSELHDNCLYSEEKISISELSAVLGKRVGEIINYF